MSVDVGNFQIQYFPNEQKKTFKKWARDEDYGGMKNLLLAIIKNKAEIEKVLKQNKK